MSDITRQPERRYRELVQTLTKLTMVAVWVVGLVVIIRHLPGINYVIPRTPITLAAMVGAGATVVLVGVLWMIAPTAASLVKTGMSGPDDAVEDLASAAYWSVVLVAIVVAHRGFAGVAVPMLGTVAWLYDIAFLLLSLPPLLAIAVRLYAGMDPAAEELTERVIRDHGSEEQPLR